MAKTGMTFTLSNYTAIKERYNLTFTTGTTTKIKPLSKYTWQTYPVDDTFITIPLKDFVGLVLKLYQFNDDLTAVEDFDEARYRFYLETKI